MELSNVRVVAEGLAFPEGPVCLDDGSVIVVEMMAGRVTRVAADGGKRVVADVGGGPNGAAVGPGGALYVCNNGGVAGEGPGSIQRLDIDSGRFETLYTHCGDRALVAPNDLVFDEAGGFWFTDFGGGAILYAAADGSGLAAPLTGLAAPNGVGLSPDGRTLYWAQTHTRQVLRRRLSGPGQVIESPGYDITALFRRGALDPDCLLIGLPGARELDSLAVDSSGAVCVGSLVESGVTVVAADGSGEQLFTLPAALADRIVTNIAFGGPALRTAYITCSQTGRLVACDWPRPGLKLAFGR